MSAKATEIVCKLLANSTNLDIVTELVAEDATYVSLNYDDPELAAIEPWCGTHCKAGPTAIHQTFVDVNRYWSVEKFDVYATLGCPNVADASDKTEHVAMFGRFVHRSKSIGKVTD